MLCEISEKSATNALILAFSVNTPKKTFKLPGQTQKKPTRTNAYVQDLRLGTLFF